MLWSKSWTFLISLAFFSLGRAQGPVQTLFPAAIPLAVKTPYMNVWYKSVANSGPLSNSWPQFWNLTGPNSNIGWEGRIRVNGVTYQWMGADGTGIAGTANVTNIQVTPTRSIFVMQAGPMNVTVTFLTPIEPDDWVKQSIPFSYLSFEAQSLDGNSYPVQVYSGITAEWASGDRSSQVAWNTVNTGRSRLHNIQLLDPKKNTENNNQAQDGTAYYAMSTSQTGITWQIDLADTIHNGFQMNGNLGNSQSTTFSSISPNFAVFGFAVNLGTIQSTASPITWSVGYVRDSSITYTAPGGAVQDRSPYYVTQYQHVADAIDAFTGDYAGAHSRAVALDQKIMSAAAKISSQYSDIVSLATRQTMSALDITMGTDSSGIPIPSDIKIFMKNLGTDRRVNPVEHIFAAFPAFLYLNASLGGALLEPLLESQASLTDQNFAAMDIGGAYPAATGPQAVSSQGVEQSGNMLIMLLAHARISGDGTLLSQYYNTIKRWADYLVGNALQSENQTNQDGNAVDLTNIALKGIIGVKAMGEIAHAVGEDSDAAEYGNQASSLLNSFLSRATSSSGSRLLGNYGDQLSSSLMYNIFADKLLGLNFVSQSVINMQTQYLNGSTEFGLPIDSGGRLGNAAWTMLASAFVSDNNLRDSMIRSIHNHANSNLSAGVFPEIYDTSDNSFKNGVAGPALGGAFSHLILTVPNQTISDRSIGGQQSDPDSSSSHVGPIVGGVVGGLAIVGIIVAILVILRKRRERRYEEADTAEVGEQDPHHLTRASYRQHHVSSDSTPVVMPSDATVGSAWIGADDKGADDRTAVSPFLDPSAKALREGTSGGMHAPAPSESVATASNVGSQMSSSSSRGLLSPDPSIATTDILGLRAEVENLRQVMHTIRAERLEPPPEYFEE